MARWQAGALDLGHLQAAHDLGHLDQGAEVELFHGLELGHETTRPVVWPCASTARERQGSG
jgi:hypothetical protein